MMKAITIEDVARLSGVSRGTVSRVINGSQNVNRETRKRVLEVIEKLGYRPNQNARRTAGGRSSTIGIVIPMIGTEFYERLIKSMEEKFRTQWYAMMLFPVLKRDWVSKVMMYDVPNSDAAGMFLCSFDIEHLFSSFRKPFEDPTVLVDSYSPLYDSIYIDNELGGYLVGRKLSKFEGSTHVIMMQESIDSGFWLVFNSRLRGFQKALLESGKNLPPRNVHSYDFSWSAGALAARDIFDNDSPPFNIFAMSDLYAFGVMREAQLRGLRIGQDVKLVGYDDQSLARDWGITTVRQPIELMGEKAVDMMLERLEKPGKEVENLCLKPEMVERESA